MRTDDFLDFSEDNIFNMKTISDKKFLMVKYLLIVVEH